MEPSGLSRYDLQRPGSAGELIVLNGRQSGTRRPLGVPVTFVGRADGCDVRLNVEGVDPFHCVLASGPHDVTLRDLASSGGTFVNGQRVSAALLRDGDLIDVGPFRFRVLLPPAYPGAVPPAERDAARVQVAAVAAQQAGLDEEEVRLLQRRLTLDQQEAQLAARLDEQRRQLLAVAEQQQAERLTLTRDREALERQIDERTGDLDLARIVLDRDRDEGQAELERARSEARTELERGRRELRERLAAEEQRLAVRGAALDQLASRLQERQAELAIGQARFNTERELDSRLLQDGWRTLEQDQQRWRARRTREGLALKVRRLLLTDSEQKLAAVRKRLLREKQAWELHQRALEGELHGLDARVLHQREKLKEQQHLRTVASHPSQSEQVPELTAKNVNPLQTDLAELAVQLADQRAELIEQWARMARVEQDWQCRRDEAANELQALADRLAQQEEALAIREREIESGEGRLRHWQERLDQLRRETTAAHVRAQVQHQARQSEHEHIVAEARRVGEVARLQLDALGELRRKWNRRRRQETETLRIERRATEKEQRELIGMRQELNYLAQQLDDRRSAVVEEAMAIREQSSSPPTDAADVQAEQLRRRWLIQNAAVLRALKEQRKALKKDLDEWRYLQEELAAKMDQLAQGRVEVQEQEAALEQREAVLAANEAHLEQQQRRTEGHRQHTERRLTLLQEETEHLARALLPDTDGPPEPLERAA